MAWQTTGDVAEFLTVAGPYLRRERVRNTTMLTVTEAMRAAAAADPDRVVDHAPDAPDAVARPLLGWWSGPDGQVAGAFLHTPPFPALLSVDDPAVAAELAEVTLAARTLPGVNAHPEVADAFAAAWQRTHGGPVRAAVHVHVSQRLYRLGELTWPDPRPEGAARVAGQPDLALVTDWFSAFAIEVHDMGRGADQSAAARERVSYGGITIWEAAGQPVALAGATRQVAGMVRIGPVYTPPEARGRGFGSAVTAAASERLLASGAEDVLLYTDLANPVSNSIYQRIGYRPVEDRVSLEFSAA